jgi:hypothetical protein
MANTAMERRYGLLSKQMERQETQQTEQEKEALRRRFAAMGGLGSGASIKAESLAGEAGARRLSQARMSLESERLREEQQQEELEKQRQFQKSERLGSQQFSSSERLGSQQFATQQAEMDRQFSSSERQAQQYWAAQQALLGREFTAEEARKMREMQQSQFDAANKLAFDEFEFNKLVTQGNERRADREADKPGKSMLEEIFGKISLNPGNLFV